MTTVVNLRRARKRAAEAKARATAAENATRHGLSRARRAQEASEAERAAALLEGHRRTPGNPPDKASGGDDGS